MDVGFHGLLRKALRKEDNISLSGTLRASWMEVSVVAALYIALNKLQIISV